MRIARILAIPLTAVVLLASSAAPAAAQTWVSLRYWPTSTYVSLAGGASLRSWDTGMVSIGLRRELPNDWSVSFNGDWGSQSNFAAAQAGATSGNDSMWNINLHRRFMAPTGMFSIFLGYESAGWSSVFPAPTGQWTARFTGFRGGVDLLYRNGPWSLMAWGATGISGTWTINNATVAAPQSSSGSYSEIGGTVGYMLSGGWNIDVGYRQVQISGGATASFPAEVDRWQGWLLGISRSFP